MHIARVASCDLFKAAASSSYVNVRSDMLHTSRGAHTGNDQGSRPASTRGAYSRTVLVNSALSTQSKAFGAMQGRELAQDFLAEADAVEFLERLAATKRRRGYQDL